MSEAFVFDALRTPRGRGKSSGSLHEVKPVRLLSSLMQSLQARHDLDTALVEDVVLGCVTPVGDQGAVIPKTAALAAGWDIQVAGVQINRFCASGLEAVNLAAQKVRSGWEDLVVAGGVESMSRVPMGTDGGAMGIICPMVNNREEAEKFVGACRYAPRGYRSSGPIRATLYGGPDYQQKADDEILAIAMIETKEAVKNLDKILSTPGLDGVYVGPSDLSISYGMGPGMDHTDDKRLDLIMKILKACKKHGVHAGLHTGSTAYAKRMREEGYQLVTLLNDSRIMAAAAKAMVDDMRGPAPAAPAAKTKGGSVY